VQQRKRGDAIKAAIRRETPNSVKLHPQQQ
jgi:hypothetical protein